MANEKPKRTIDERLDAIAQSLELLTSMHVELEKQTAKRFSETLEFINQLAHIAKDHEHRIGDLEDKK